MNRDGWNVLSGRSATLAAARPGIGLVRGLAVAPAFLLLLVGAAFSWRRLDGALAAPLDWPGLLAAGLFVAALAALARGGGRALAGEEPRRRRLTLECLVSASALSAAAALSLPGTGWLGLALCWGALAAEECWAWQSAVWPGRASRATGAAAGHAPEAGPWSAGRPAGRPADRPADRPAGDVIQQITRRRTIDGREALSGWIRVPLAPGQRSATVHVAFCPPLCAPQMAVQQCEGPPARIRAVQVLPYGARLDVKLVQPSPAAVDLLLEFTARAAGTDAAGDAPASH